MKKMTMFTLVIAFLMGGQAQATLLLTPGGEYTSETSFPAYHNPDAADVSAIVVTSQYLLYKDNVGGVEEGMANFMASYETTYLNTPSDPSGAIISYMGGEVMQNAAYLLVKDGNHAPSWYLFDISLWDGIDDIQLSSFWPTQGAISHVSIFGPSSPVPEPATMLLLGTGLAGLAGSRIRRKKKA